MITWLKFFLVLKIAFSVTKAIMIFKDRLKFIYLDLIFIEKSRLDGLFFPLIFNKRAK